MNQNKDAQPKCKVCGECGTFSKIAFIPFEDLDLSSLKLHDAVYCDNCGHGVFDLNEPHTAIDIFNKVNY